jgi:putative transposase
MSEEQDNEPGKPGKIIRIDEAEVESLLGRKVRESVEETLNGLLDAEADALCGAGRYERNAERVDTLAGHYERKLHTKAGEVKLKVPKLRSLPFESQIIERYRRRESSVEEALMEMYLAGVSVRRVEDITEALWGTRVSPSTVSDLNKKVYARIEEWRNERDEKRRMIGPRPPRPSLASSKAASKLSKTSPPGLLFRINPCGFSTR